MILFYSFVSARCAHMHVYVCLADSNNIRFEIDLSSSASQLDAYVCVSMCVHIFMPGSNSELKYTQRPNFCVDPQLKYTILF